MKRTLTELVTARYEPGTDTIGGCTDGSLAWHHENRHREQLNFRPARIIVHVTHLFLVGVGGAAILGGVLHGYVFNGLAIAGIAMTPYLVLQLVLELDAWGVSLYRVQKDHVARDLTQGN